ncbi:hypothetical protein GUB10_11940 [Salegentibacter sp. BLCTC]|uniref:hypothetical protein n=1 Tax=Salegentibacter sp. BLCTC TaxID=2697368 RepID=UPI00187B52C4|nr:hypothetical protein [Salegentibacter sp. BLCTC]MBE7641046.1 hypothetical protein [Salegentibacter sp. BLCTC]
MEIEKFDTQFASLAGKDIYIQNAESGRRGYTCIGCERPLEAVRRRKNPDHKSYFRHIVDSKEKDNFKCDFNVRRYLERLVEKIIIKQGSILVPPVIKYPDSGSFEPPLLLQEAKNITSKIIKAQQTFFIDENGKIQSGAKAGAQKKNYYIRPDLTFYDHNGDPKLFIEIVFAHPIDDEKKSKLIHISIDTIRIDLPVVDREKLKELIELGQNTNWVFNNEEFYTDYLSITNTGRKKLHSLAEKQREFQQESFNCRAGRIRELIRTIKQCLESDTFKEIENQLRSEVERVGRLAESAKSGLARMEKEEKRGLYSEFEREEKKLAESESREQAASAELKCRYFVLEERYSRKAEELGEEESAIRRRERDVFGAENPFESLPRRTAGLENDIQRIKNQGKVQEGQTIQVGPEERGIDEQLEEFNRIETRLGL